MSVKISGFYDEYSYDFKTQLKAVKGFGESYMCPRVINGKNISSFTAEEFEKEILPLMKEAEVKFSSIGSPIGKLALDDDEGYNAQLGKLKQLIEICKLTGCRYIRIFSFFVKPKGDYDGYLPKVVEKLKGFLAVAEGSGVTLIHENEKKIYGDTPDRCLKLIGAIDHPQFKLAFDSSNFIQCGVNPWEAYQLLKDYAVYYHVKDCSLLKVEVPLGMGAGMYKEILTDLIKVRGYDGFLTMEPHTGKYADLKIALNFLFPIAALIKPARYWHRVFKQIDKAKGIKHMQRVNHTQPFEWQYQALTALLAEIG